MSMTTTEKKDLAVHAMEKLKENTGVMPVLIELITQAEIRGNVDGYKEGYGKGYDRAITTIKKSIDRIESEVFIDEVGGCHDEGIGWNPQGVWCGECGNATCKGCPHEFTKK